MVDLRPLITREMTFDQLDEAFTLLDTGQACKIVLRPNASAKLPPQTEAAPARDPNIKGQVVHP